MHDDVWAESSKRGAHGRRVPDVRPLELEFRRLGHGGETFHIARVRQAVKGENPSAVSAAQPSAYEGGTDESGRARYKQLHLRCVSQSYAIRGSSYGRRPSSLGS